MYFIMTQAQLQEISTRIARQMTWEQANPIMVILDKLEPIEKPKDDELAD